MLQALGRRLLQLQPQRFFSRAVPLLPEKAPMGKTPHNGIQERFASKIKEQPLIQVAPILNQDKRNSLLAEATAKNNVSKLQRISKELQKANPNIILANYWIKPEEDAHSRHRRDILDPVALNGSDQVLAFLIDIGCNIASPSSRLTLMHVLCHQLLSENHLKTLALLIKAGEDVNACGDKHWGYSPLSRVICFRKNNPEIALKAVVLLIENGANPNLQGSGLERDTALHKAAQVKNFDIAQYLLHNDFNTVNLHAFNKRRQNAAHILCMHKEIPVKFLQYLIDEGIAIDVPDSTGKSVVDYLTERQLLDQFELPEARHSAQP